MKIIYTYIDNHTKFIYSKIDNTYYIRTYKQGFYLLFKISKSQIKKFKQYNQLPKEIKKENLILNNDAYRIIKTKNKRLKTNLKINNSIIQTTTNKYKELYNKSNDLGINTFNINNVLINISIKQINNILKTSI